MSTNKYDNQFHKKFYDLKHILLSRERDLSNIVNEILSSTKTDHAHWNDIKRRLDVEYREINVLCENWAFNEIPKQYRFVLKEQMAKAKSLKSITNRAEKTVSQLLKSNNVKQIQTLLAQSAIDDITTGLLQGRRDLDKLISRTRQKLVQESFVDTGLIESIETGNIAISKILKREGTVANKLLKANENNRFIKIINKNGEPMTFRITYYTEMVYRSKWHEAQSQAVRTNNANWGTDLIRVSNHNTITEICQQYEGKIFSLNGKNKDFPIIDQMSPFHVNCLHYETTIFEESLKTQGVYDDYVQFSNNKTNKPPGQNGFIPIKERNNIIKNTTKEVRESDKYQNSTTRQKRNLLRDKIGEALGKAA